MSTAPRMEQTVQKLVSESLEVTKAQLAQSHANTFAAQQKLIVEQQAVVDVSIGQIQALTRTVSELQTRVNTLEADANEMRSEIEQLKAARKFEGDGLSDILQRVNKVVLSRVSSCIGKEHTAREESEQRIYSKIANEVERMQLAMAEGLAGIPYAMAKVDTELQEEQRNRERSMSQLEQQLLAEMAGVQREVAHRMDGCDILLTKSAALNQASDTLHESLALEIDKQVALRMNEFEQRAHMAHAATAEASKESFRLERLLEERLSSSGRKFQSAMAKWCREAIRKSEDGLQRANAVREEAEKALLEKLVHESERLDGVIQEGLSGMRVAIAKADRRSDQERDGRLQAEEALRAEHQGLAGELHELSRVVSESTSTLTAAHQLLLDQHSESKELTIRQVELIEGKADQSEQLVKQELYDLKTTLWETLRLEAQQNQRKLLEQSEAIWRTLQHIQSCNEDIL